MTALFFVLAFGVTWGLQWPAVFSAAPERFMPLVGLGAFGPMFAAMIAAKVEGTGVRALMRPLGIWRVGVVWYVVALLLPGVIFAIAAAVYNAFGHAEPLVYPPNQPAFVLAALVFPFGEEIGWRGFALPRLRERWGALGASVIIGVFWTFWHIPMLTLQGVPARMVVVFLPYMVSCSIVFTWIWVRARESLLLAVVAHVGVHLSNPGRAMPGRYTPMIIETVVYCALAVLLVAFDRKAFTPRRSQRPAKAAPTAG